MKFSNLTFSSSKFFLILALSGVLAACGTSNKGGFYKNDGPGKRKVDIDSIPNAVPKDEPFIATTLEPYTINDKRYVPLKSAGAYLEEGRASWYGRRYHGRKTSTGEVYDMFKMTAAHPTLPLPSYVRVTNVNNQRSVIVRLNDRGPFIGDRIIDLSYVAAKKLGVVSAGTGNVIVESVLASSQIDLSTQAVTNPAATNPTAKALPAGPIPTPSQNNANVQRPQLAPNQQVNQLAPNQQVNQNDVSPQPVNPAINQWVQVGAFSVSKNAEGLLSRLKVSGYNNAQIVPQNALFKVLVGPLSADQASTTIRSLKTNGYSAIKTKR